MQQGVGVSRRVGRPSPAMVVAVIALIVALSGTAFAAFQLPKNSVGSRQLKRASVTAGKLANNAVNGAKVANGSLTGADINIGALGTVPTAAEATHAANADTVSGHSVACPPGTTPVRGLCFDASSNGPANSVQEAADACANKGGWLPSPFELYSARHVLNLSVGGEQFTDTYYNNANGSPYKTLTIDGLGNMAEHEPDQPANYICVYQLVR